jgi:hypothetical protein
MQYTDDSGAILNGGELYFYEAGTTTPKTTWADSAMQSANDNPVTLDSTGRATIFVRGLYKVILKDSDGVTISTWDYMYFPNISTAGASLIDDTSVANMRQTLGLGTAAVLDVGTSGNEVVQFNASAQYPANDGSLITNIGSGGSVAAPYGYIAGLILSRTANQTFGISAGAARDSSNTRTMSLTSSWTKTLSAWSAGTAGGSLDTGTAALSTWYHIFVIYNATTSSTDVLLSTSATSPTMPSGYTSKRRIGSIKTDASVYITSFTQVGNEFLWSDPPLDINMDGTLGTSASTLTLSVPTGIKVWAMFNASGSHGSTVTAIYISSPDVDDEAADWNANTLVGSVNVLSTAAVETVPLTVRTNTSAQVRARAQNASTYLSVSTLGWRDDRGSNG